MKNLLLLSLFPIFCTGVYCQTAPAGCPVVSVIGPAGVTGIGEPMFFRADVSGNSIRDQLRFKWTISAGEITDGQSTDQIRVVSDIGGVNVTATVKVKGLPKQCDNSASETASVAAALPQEPIDDYGDIPWDEERARLDNVWITLTNNPKSQAFFLIEISEKETNDDTKKHIIEILKHFKFRDPDFDPGRLTFAIEKSESHNTIVGIFSDGAELPDCKDCEVMNGKHIYF